MAHKSWENRGPFGKNSHDLRNFSHDLWTFPIFYGPLDQRPGKTSSFVGKKEMVLAPTRLLRYISCNKLPGVQMHSSHSTTTLAPCPFCGKNLCLGQTPSNPTAMCKTPNCFGQKMPALSLRDTQDVARWNSRPTTTEHQH